MKPMKIGVSSYSFAQYMGETKANYFQIIDLAKEMGFDAIEFIDLKLEVQPAESLSALAKDIRAYCESKNLPIAAYTVGADFLNRKNEAERVKGQVDIAEILGAPVMRHDAFWSLPEGMTWRQGVEKVAPLIREVTEYAAAKGIRTCTENHGLILQDAERVETLIRTVNHPNYGWLVDMGNFLCADDNPLRAVPIAAPYAFHAHVKDFIFKSWADDDPGDGWIHTRNGNYIRGTVAGHGVVPIRKCLSILKDAGYKGVVSYEFEGHEQNLPALKNALKFIRKAAE
ncbi:MAG: sugar phosphate isomerase/epimerase [Clostridia bacterium]|nr:sugar phosphate isomerase/epimerase [Clostridia bacterium]